MDTKHLLEEEEEEEDFCHSCRELQHGSTTVSNDSVEASSNQMLSTSHCLIRPSWAKHKQIVLRHTRCWTPRQISRYCWAAFMVLLVSTWPSCTLSSPLPLFVPSIPQSSHYYSSSTTHLTNFSANNSVEEAGPPTMGAHPSIKVNVSKPKWVNPCGLNPHAMHHLTHTFGNHYEITPLSDSELLHNVILAAKNALKHSRFFKEDYVKKTFRTPSWWDHHETWKDMRYDWLPSWNEVPKHLHERPHVAHLKDLELKTSLRSMYTFLQKLAVGLEQVVLDQTVYDGRFMEEFNEAEFKLKAVLCELQVAMLEKGISQEETVSRHIMSPEVRDIEDESYRNLRDWYIYRDYMNGLEYVIHAFNHIRRQNQREQRRHRRQLAWPGRPNLFF